jgi:hypothetical protein
LRDIAQPRRKNAEPTQVASCSRTNRTQTKRDGRCHEHRAESDDATAQREAHATDALTVYQRAPIDPLRR